MIINFSVKYDTEGDESVSVRFEEGEDGKLMELPLKDRTGGYCKRTINTEDHPVHKKLRYSIILRNENIKSGEKKLATGNINLKKYKFSVINIIHETTAENISDIKLNKPFCQFKQPERKASKQASSKKATHIFRTSLPMLQDNKFLCLTGSAGKMNLFNKEKPLFFKKNKNNKGELRLNLSKEIFPFEYKIAVFDNYRKSIAEYEPGPNRIIELSPEKKSLTIINADYSSKTHAWKGAGLNIPLFSLRSLRSWGVGDFTDMLLLIDYVAVTGLKLIHGCAIACT